MAVGMELNGITLFFIFIIPGFVFTRTYLAYKPRYYQKPNTIEQTALSLIGSAFIHGSLLGAVMLGIIIAWTFGANLNIGLFFDPAIQWNQYPLQIPALFLISTIGYFFLSLIIARRSAIFLGKRSPFSGREWWHRVIGEDPPENFLLWHQMLQDEPLKRGFPHPRVNIRLRNGDHFRGRLSRLKLVGDEANSIELALTDVYYRPLKDEATGVQPTALTNQTVLLQSKDILWLSRADSETN